MIEDIKRAIDGKRLNFTSIGTITSLNTNRYLAKVMLEPIGVETGWIPIGTQQVGEGYGIVTMPNIGDQVVVLLVNGSVDNGIVVCRLYNAIDVAPKGIQPGETYISKDSSYIKLHSDGSITIHSDEQVTISGPTQSSTWR